MKQEVIKQIVEGLSQIQKALQSLCEDSQEKEQPVTLEDVRKVLAEISRSGKTAEMKALLEKFGATKLSSISPEKYGELMAAAKEIANA